MLTFLRGAIVKYVTDFHSSFAEYVYVKFPNLDCFSGVDDL